MKIFVKNSFEVKHITDIEDMYSPSIFLKISVTKNRSFVFATIYRSPNCIETDHDNICKQIDAISKRYSKLDDKVVICGDFNYPDINWNTVTCTRNNINKSCMFLNTIQENFLYQIIKEPTHHRCQQTPTLIDLILTNDVNLVNNVDHFPPFGKSHHSVICFSLDIEPPPITPSSTLKYLVDKGDYASMSKSLERTDWDSEFTGPTEECWSKFHTILDSAIHKYVPSKIYKPNVFKINKHAPPTLLNKIRLKRRAFKFYKKFPTKENYDRYARLRNQVKWESRKATRNREKYIASVAKTNPKSFFKYVNSKIKCKVNISNLKKDDGTLTENDLEKANVLKTFFTSVFTHEPDGPLPDFEPKTDRILSNLTVTQDQMLKKLQSLKISKTPGPDGLHPRVLRELANVLAYPLTLLCNKSISEGNLATPWKKAEVKPILKKGEKSDPGNYRPVSLTPIVCRIFESFIRDALYDHLISTGLLSDKQFGFCKGRSCVTQLLCTIHSWMKSLDNKKAVDAIYLDFSKAFDTVPHKRLIHKLKMYGIQGNVLNWITDFLSNRSQFVTVNGSSSEPAPVSSGVPQGSVLGPILFIYYINDMPDVTEEELKIFADDTKGSNEIENDVDVLNLQKCIDNLTEWSKLWLLKFNGPKCGVLHMGKNNEKHDYFITLNGITHKLNKTILEKDLGVFLDPDLNFSQHITTKVNKAKSMCGLLIRTITYKIKDIMIPLYKSLIRPIIEYANPVWCPYTRNYIDLIEDIQHYFTRCIIGMKDMDYESRLRKLKLPSLEYRRVRGDLIEVYKICHHIYDPVTTSPLLTFAHSNTRAHNYKLNKPRVNTKQFQHFFSNPIVLLQ